MKNINITDEFSLEVKRFYFPIKLDTKCPNCGEINKYDFGDSYLSYPVINRKESVYVYCDHCDSEYEFDCVLRIGLDVDVDSRKL